MCQLHFHVPFIASRFFLEELHFIKLGLKKRILLITASTHFTKTLLYIQRLFYIQFTVLYTMKLC